MNFFPGFSGPIFIRRCWQKRELSTLLCKPNSEQIKNIMKLKCDPEILHSLADYLQNTKGAKQTSERHFVNVQAQHRNGLQVT